MSQVDYFLIAGEPSGDLHGAKLIKQLLLENPKLKIAAVSGPQMRKLAVDTLFDVEDLSVMGFIDVLIALPKIFRMFFKIRTTILQLQPKAIIFIDYPGFNLRLQNSLRKKGFKGKLIHYICPSVWAWGKKRIPLMEKNLDLLLTFFPFEPKCFTKTKLHVEYVGHPLVHAIPDQTVKKHHLFAIFPGSRKAEIIRNLPLQIAVAKQLQRDDPTLQVAISISHPDKETLIYEIAKDFKCLFFDPEKTYELMKIAKFALATSGTVTLELALHNTPSVVTYAIRPIDVFIAQKIFQIHLEFYCIVNLIAKKEIFPEFFGPRCTFENVYRAVKKLNPPHLPIRELLTTKNAMEETTKLLSSLIEK